MITIVTSNSFGQPLNTVAFKVDSQVNLKRVQLGLKFSKLQFIRTSIDNKFHRTVGFKQSKDTYYGATPLIRSDFA